MVFCRGCGKEIHDSAVSCPHCGAIQEIPIVRRETKQVTSTITNKENDGLKWMPITSIILGVICLLGSMGLSGESPMDKDGVMGCLLFSIAGVVFGSISLSKQLEGRGMAIAGIVLSSISILALVGMLAS